MSTIQVQRFCLRASATLLLATSCAPSARPAARPNQAASPENSAARPNLEPNANTQVTEKTSAPIAPTQTNSGTQLIAYRTRIERIEITDGDEVLAKLGADVVRELTDSLPAAVSEGISATSPPWPDYRIRIHAAGRSEPFIASVLALGGLRLKESDPWSNQVADQDGVPAFDDISELGESEKLYAAMVEHLGAPQSEEYARPPHP